jgi:hypothetical protein
MVEVQITNYPSGLLEAVKADPDWELVMIHKDPYPDGQTDYEIRCKDRCILRYSRWHGYGFGSCAVYPTMKMSDYELLKSVYPNHCRVWRVV